MNRVILSSIFRELAVSIEREKQQEDAFDVIEKIYGIKVSKDEHIYYVIALLESLRKLPFKLVKDCGIKKIEFRDLGESKEYYPNHGIYVNNVLTLNINLLEDPKVIIDRKNKVFFTKFDQTFYHELGHGWDHCMGKDVEYSMREDWLKLSGWSKVPVEGYRRVHIYDIESPVIKGEYYYSPDAKFTRFYGRRNPWDDWADCFSYYVGGLFNFIPLEKKKYFDNLLKDYYKDG